MLKKLSLCFFILILAGALGLAKEKPKLEIQVVESRVDQREVGVVIPGTPSRTSTNYNVNAVGTANGNSASVYGSGNSTSTTTPGIPPQIITRNVPQISINIVMPDQRRLVIWCDGRKKNCADLDAGPYDAEVNGNDLIVYSRELLSGKDKKWKYKAVGTW